MKKWKIVLMAALSTFLLAACQGNNDNDTGMGDGNVEPTRYNNTDNNNLMRRNADNTADTDDRNTNGDDQQPRYQVADDASKKVNEISGIDNAYVFTTDNNAFVAVDMGDTNNNNVTDDMKKKVTDAVKSVDEDIDNVYVSADPDFINMARDYNDNIDNGQPIEGFFLEFGEMINRVFPNNE